MESSEGVILIASLFFALFFTGMSVAFLSANKLKIELDGKQGVFSAVILSGLLRKQSKFIATLLVGSHIALVVFAVYSVSWLEPKLVENGVEGVWIPVLQTAIAGIVVLFFGEFIPRTVFRLNPNFLMKVFAVPVLLAYYALWIPMRLITGIAQFVVKYILRLDLPSGSHAYGRMDLDNFLREIADNAEEKEEDLEHEIQIFQNALDFSKVKARDCMVPRTEIAAVEVDDDVEKLKNVFIDTGYSRVLVYRESIDNIIGFVNSMEMFRKVDSIKRLIVPVIIIPETISAREVLRLFIKQNKSIAVVVDEFGGTSGMLTIEDVMEEIFGDIEDEHDQEVLLEEKVNDNLYHFSARLEIDYLNEKYKFDLPESEEYETLAGLILNRCEDIPDVHDVVEIEPYRITITGSSDVRIDSIRLEILPED